MSASPFGLEALQKWKLDRLAYRLWRYNPVALVKLLGHHAFDRRYGVETRGYGDLRYEPTPAAAFERMLGTLFAAGVEPGAVTFVDIGSGKGKVVLLASTYPFRRVVGVELYPEFHETARENLSGFPESERRARDVTLECVDAAEYVLPDGPLVLYFFNPFPVEILERVLANVETAIDAGEREIHVIYYAPIVFRDTPWDRRRIFDRSERLEIVAGERDLTIYRGRPVVTPTL